MALFSAVECGILANASHMVAEFRLIPSNVPQNGPLWELDRFLNSFGLALALGSAALVVMYGAWMYFSGRAQMQKRVNEQYAKAHARWPASVVEATPAWRRRMERWQNLFYCARCDSVFIPGERDSLKPVSQMAEALG
jgi:hypothetical protein